MLALSVEALGTGNQSANLAEIDQAAIDNEKTEVLLERGEMTVSPETALTVDNRGTCK